ncbi:hypothetical protein [Maridesulfovibrio sp. FT414]|uniref:hypothetical protein n=1 Tax=Maridesulfovibrio sp. FT414 TaxID=2979469 RepID=UPI003D80771E
MSRSFYRLLCILLCTALAVPVCGVVAGDKAPWRIFMPVVQPVAVSVESSSAAADTRRSVSGVVLRSESISGEGRVVRRIDPDPVETVDFSIQTDSGVQRTEAGAIVVCLSDSVPAEPGPVEPGPVEPGSVEPGSVSYGTGASTPVTGAAVYADASGSTSKITAKKEPVMVSSRSVDNEDRYTDPSVSLVPSDNAEERRWKSSENGLFFTTPKRFLGLSGTFVRAIPSINIREMYDSNIDYTDIADFITEITPSLNVDVIGEEANLKINGDFIYRDYLENSKFDRYDYNVNIAGKFKFTPKVEGGLSLEHKRYHNLDQNTYEAGGVELDPTIVLKTSATPEVNWRISERDNIRVSNYMDKTDYERAADSDYMTNVLSVIWGHLLPNEVTSVFAGQMFTFTHFSRELDELNSDQVSFQGVVGIDHNFSPGWKMSVKGGPGMTYSNYSNDAMSGDSEDFLYQVRAEVGYRQLKYSIVPAVERVVRPGRYGENEVMDQVELYARYDFTEFLKYDTINTWWLNETDGKNGGQKHKASGIFTQHIMRWEFEKDWKWMVGFSYNWGRNELSGTVNERVKTWMGLTYSFPTEIK